MSDLFTILSKVESITFGLIEHSRLICGGGDKSQLVFTIR